ncbi:nephrocan-like [Pygocentrus nattereri]|uniref:LRRCT domain-containing protein n=1 Tax=Pygocentrus nattereri TaxID=42514 RepID=A0A3B4DVD0_PYGNA|nr:nephrocan-like [Pygocentrus nattereri]
MWTLHILLYSLLFSLHSLCSQTCPEKCICEQTASVQCFRVQAIPSGIPRDTRKLNLGHNHIKEIKSRDLSNLPGLEEVILSSCGVEQLEGNTFRAQKVLKTLDLQKNKLRNIPRGLPSSLESLHLGHNRIHTLQESTLQGLKKLRLMNLQNNLIATLRSSTFSALTMLESLFLEGNKIETVQGALRLPNLNQFSLANNKISSLPSTFFSSLQHLKTLDLSSNLLNKVPHDLPQALLHLNLDRNHLRTLKSRDMVQLRDLATLTACHNRLVSVDGSLRLPSLTVLELAGNYLRVLPGRLSARLEKLDCGQNHIQEVTHQQLSGMKQLRHLFLENNTIQHFESNALRNCLHLTNLALEQNLLSTFPNGLPETLVRLDLKGNRIVTIEEHELKSLKRLQVLNLRNNGLSSLPVMSLLPKLQMLYVDGNPWNCSCELLKVKRALLARDVDISSDFCSETVHTSVDIWQAYVMTQDKCEETEESLPEKQSEHTDNEDYYDYDL